METDTLLRLFWEGDILTLFQKNGNKTLCRSMTYLFVFYSGFSGSEPPGKWMAGSEMKARNTEINLEVDISGDIIGVVAMTEGMRKGHPNNGHHLGSESILSSS